MTARDRMMLIGIVVIAVLGAAWMMAVSPARKQAAKAGSEVESARSQLAQALSEAAEARNAQSRYHSAYASLASLGQAVPTTPEVPTLVYALDKASSNHKVQFSSIATGAKGASSSSSSASASAAEQAAPFTEMPFTLAFAGSYQDLIHLLSQLERFTVQSPSGPVEVSGRLLTVQSITLGTSSGAASSTTSAASAGAMTWTIAASAYVLAPTSPTTGSSGTAGSGAPTSGTAGATPAAGGASTATPAVVRAGG
ncbi:MAG: type II secretion system protein GspM [Solirubrobacteraceae bacterium]